MTTNGTETKEIFKDPKQDEVYGGVGLGLLAWLGGAGESIPPWWSVSRDQALRTFWRSGDHLSGTVNTLRDMLLTIPVGVLARDGAIKSHHRQADEFTEILLNDSYSRSNPTSMGWGACFGPFIEDIYTQDNGGFLAIEGPGRPDGPLTGAPTALIHLDAGQCMRTRSKEFPVIYTDYDGRMYKLHQSRVIVISQQSSPVVNMNGVGFCSVSKSIHNAQVLMDIGNYKQEKLGSRQRRAILVADGAGPKDVKAIEDILALADEQMDNLGLRRFAKIPIIGFRQGGGLTLVDLVSLPDGFDEMTSTQLGMAALALAFGVDSRQLAFAIGVSGVTKADAEIQHLKMANKGPSALVEEIERQFNAKFLPPHLRILFDYKDDSKDQLQAEIRAKRAERRERDLNSGVINIRTAREQMVEAGDLNPAQFNELEMEDGRLDDGTDVLTLFYSPDPFFVDLLEIGLDDPLAITANDPEEALLAIETAAVDAQALLASLSQPGQRRKALQALSALSKLQEIYRGIMTQQLLEEQEARKLAVTEQRESRLAARRASREEESDSENPEPDSEPEEESEEEETEEEEDGNI